MALGPLPALALSMDTSEFQPAAGRSAGAPRLSLLADLLELPPVLTVADAIDATPHSLLQAQAAAQAWSTDVQAAQQRLLAFHHARDAARGAFLPRMDARLAGGKGELSSVDPSARLKRGEATLSLRQALFDESARQGWNRQGLLVGSAEMQLDNALSQALLESGAAYLAALQLRVSMALANEYEQLLAELLRYVSERAKAGGASPADRERVRSRVANVRSSLADTRSSLEAALRNLHRLTGIRLEAFELTLEDSAPSLPSRGDALEQARSGNAELLAARAEVLAAEAEYKSQRGRMMPRVELEVAYSRSRNAAGSASEIKDTKAMLSLTVPILNGGADLAQMRGAQARQDELSARALGVERRLALEVETAYTGLEAATARLASVREELEANRQVVEAFRAQLLGGNRSLLDVLDAFQRLHQSRLDITQLLVAQEQTRLRIAHLTGTLVPTLQQAPAELPR